MKTLCYSVRLESLVKISDKAYKATSFDGTTDIIPASQVFGQDYDVIKSDAYWISAWILDKKIEDRITSTVRHNMARGTHQVELSAKLIVLLKKHNWPNARIGMELGMDADEVLRLKQITGLAEAFKNEEFSKSWIIEDNGKEEQ